jgi:uncharacterized protein RhaS with RHS repeats
VGAGPDPQLGRYLSEDPIGLLGGTALYGYVEDSALWIDPFGLKKCKVNKKTQKRLKGSKPPGEGWHMHHIVMEGAFSHWKKEHRAYVEGARDILKKHNIDLQGGLNVVWAKNEGHSVEYAKDVYERLAAAGSKGKVKRELVRIAGELNPG